MDNIIPGLDNKTLIKYAVLAVAGYLLYKYLKNNLFKGNEARTEISKLLEADTSEQVKGKATITEVQASQYAARIKSAWGIFNDDEEAIYSVIAQLHNLADLFLVIEKYGYYQPNALLKKEDLPTSMARLNAKEIEKVNKMLSERGINYAF